MTRRAVETLRALPAQRDAGSFLANALEGNMVGHAYLFVGPPGSGKMEAALALAEGIVCPNGGCGACEDCARVQRGAHPDVHVLQPGSSQGYLIDQVRGMIDEIGLAPVRSKRRAWLVNSADALTSASANALLKSLEEPPRDVVFVLLATSSDAVLPTISSRCQIVPFRPVDRELMARALSDELGVPPAMCRRALSCCATPTSAKGFVRSESRQEARRRAIDGIAMLERADELDILGYARQTVLAAKAPLSEFKDAQTAALEENAKILSSAALRELEERQKRELSARERSGIMETFAAQASFLRDALGRACDSREEPVCDDYTVQAARLASVLGVDGVLGAIAEVGKARDRVAKNVSPQLAIESMLFTIKEMFPCQP